MIGNTLSEFIDDILTMGGPEKEFLFRGKKVKHFTNLIFIIYEKINSLTFHSRTIRVL